MTAAVEIGNLSKRFRLYHEKYSSLKERVVHAGHIPYEEFWALRDISAEIAGYPRADDDGGTQAQPRLDYPPYRSSALRHPKQPLLVADPEELERAGPCFGPQDVDSVDADLTAGHPGEPIGERIILAGRLLDDSGRAVAGQLIEVWQANAGGRYRHRFDQHPAPLDPNFVGAGRCLTGPDG